MAFSVPCESGQVAGCLLARRLALFLSYMPKHASAGAVAESACSSTHKAEAWQAGQRTAKKQGT